LRKAKNLYPCTANRIRRGNAGSLYLKSWSFSDLSEQKSLRHWNNVAIACCSDSGLPRFCHGVCDSGNATYKTRTDQLMLCPCVAREQSQSLKPFRNSNPVPISNPWIQEATESYVTFRRNIAGRD
jgi:sulfatase maturation enzyme AslB (radical SAM superfamily)